MYGLTHKREIPIEHGQTGYDLNEENKQHPIYFGKAQIQFVYPIGQIQVEKDY